MIDLDEYGLQFRDWNRLHGGLFAFEKSFVTASFTSRTELLLQDPSFSRYRELLLHKYQQTSGKGSYNGLFFTVPLSSKEFPFNQLQA